MKFLLVILWFPLPFWWEHDPQSVGTSSSWGSVDMSITMHVVAEYNTFEECSKHIGGLGVVAGSVAGCMPINVGDFPPPR